ncbi:MAG TPA: O-methyltransferase [Candidatus Thermoplasmatota archaeon]|nr:O-methyltransferase [Candidatus Thermoplasmatota archaeon]
MIVEPTIERYLLRMQVAEDPVLAEMERIGEDRGFPIVGPLVGRLLEQYARGIGATSVFEMGSGFGYSTAWFARGVGSKGRVVHTDSDPALSKEAKEWLGKGGLGKRVEFRIGDAVDLLKRDKGPYDVIFIDIDKEQYPNAWELARDRVRVGGLVLTDNALWHGKVAGKANDAATRGVREYNRLAQADDDYLTTILPVRDGLSVSLRIK